MTSDQIGGLIGLGVFLVLPMLIGLILLLKARSLARARLRFLADASHQHLEPSQTAVWLYRFAGLVLLIAPPLVFLFGILAAMHQS